MAKEKGIAFLDAESTLVANHQQDAGENWEVFAERNLELILPQTEQAASDKEASDSAEDEEEDGSFTVRQQLLATALTNSCFKV
tara:strand:+ start:414 stop:665 length:252 start_codon:yes stop_codon:yes gene_type:complete